MSVKQHKVPFFQVVVYCRKGQVISSCNNLSCLISPGIWQKLELHICRLPGTPKHRNKEQGRWQRPAREWGQVGNSGLFLLYTIEKKSVS
ncbi:TPA: hypothetical protein GDO54_018419 [Pyxicephalus adspersus]|uniref:Uncharacterized protein n=1 Tax=Pyxicephalus adspersus TaxID=30357 RepID=A0AAV2ZTR9_PYXAD|nr:TPA: hypothetical protein GDO54_018419 [Pyxicephalus adspersus]